MASAGPVSPNRSGVSPPPDCLLVSERPYSRAVGVASRSRWWATLVILTTAPGAAQALGLGPLEVRSSLGEPLRAVAPLYTDGQESVEAVEAGLADRQTYRDFGLTPPALSVRLRLQVVSDPHPHIRITSPEPVRTPMFGLLVRLNEQGTAMLKEYTLALDPPGQGAQPPKGGKEVTATAEKAPKSASKVSRDGQEKEVKRGGAGASEAPRPKVEVTEGWAKRDRYGPVRSGDALATIVERLRRADSVPKASALAATWAANKDAFIDGNMNLLRQGAVLTMPDEEEVRSYSPQKAEALIARHRKEWRGRDGDSSTNVGHRRYALEVSLGSEDKAASKTGNGDRAAQQPEPDEAQGEGDRDGGQAEGKQSPDADQGSEAGGSGGGSEEAEPSTDADTSPTKAEAKAATDEVADLRQRVRDLQQALAERGSGEGEKVKALEDRVSGLQDQVQEQKTLLEKQSQALTQLSQRPDGRSQSRPLLWVLAALNLLFVAALGVLGGWLVRGNRREEASSGGSDEGNAVVAPVGTKATTSPSRGEEADPLTQVQRHLAEGDTGGAKSVLEAAIESEPANWGLYDRLLTLLERDGDGERFEEVADRLFRQLGDTHPEWQADIRRRGRQLLPNSPVFAEPGSTGGAGGSDGAESHEPVEEELVFPGFDAESGSAEEEDRQAHSTAEEDEDLVLTLDEGDAQRLAQESEEPASSSSAGTEENAVEEPMEFSFELEDEGPSEAESEQSEEEGQPEDEMAIKLDLAQAWLDMGDAESAKPLLEEVVAKGDSDQQAQARQKLADLG